MEIEKVSGDYRPLILVAEDDDSNFKLIKAIIGKKCEILWAKNGEDIVNLFEEIRKKDKELPIIMQTAYAFTADREKALECGASEVLVKPITLSALRTCLSRYLPKLVW